MTIGMVIKFTDEDGGGEVAKLDDTQRAYMVLVGAVQAGESIERDAFLSLAADAWEAVNEAPAGTVLQ